MCIRDSYRCSALRRLTQNSKRPQVRIGGGNAPYQPLLRIIVILYYKCVTAPEQIDLQFFVYSAPYRHLKRKPPLFGGIYLVYAALHFEALMEGSKKNIPNAAAVFHQPQVNPFVWLCLPFLLVILLLCYQIFYKQPITKSAVSLLLNCGWGTTKQHRRNPIYFLLDT